ncbi:hypothetical protein ACFLXQ_08525 [Chloroflexota bacterium]
MPETKHTFIKEKDSYLIYDSIASIGDERDLVISEWYYYLDDGWEHEYFITIPVSEVEKLYQYLPEVSRKKTPAPVRENKDKLFLFRLKRFYRKKKFKNLRYDFRNWLDSEEIKYDYSVW